MLIVYENLPQELKGFVDALQIIQDAGSDREQSLLKVQEEIELTESTLKKGSIHPSHVIDLMAYKNRLHYARLSLRSYFK